MSLTQPIQAAQGRHRRQNPWIVDWKQDLLWFIAPPLLLVPAFTVLLQRIPLEQLSLLIVTLGAVGHHLPGMLRAYGDQELFERYRVRFIAAPIFLVSVCVVYSFYRPDALGIIIVAWGFWHSQAQIYGFLRIYDSKVGMTSSQAAWVDRLVCLSWFAGGIAMSDGRVADFLTVYYRCGGISVATWVISAIRTAMLILMVCSGLFYLFFLRRNWARGIRPSVVKIIALVLSVGFWWYCMVGIRNIVLGVALYEVFHDVQYLAIVWFFNRRRASTGSSAGWLTQFLFRPRVRFVILYICLVLAYGGGSLLTHNLDHSVFQTILTGLFAASGLLHFYYDGFIWRIRDRKTGQTLGVEGDEAGNVSSLKQPRGLKHAAMWAIFATPLLIFSFTPQTKNVQAMVVQSLPESAAAHYDLAVTLHKQGELDRAEEHTLWALDQRPDWAKAWSLRGEIFLSRDRPDKAVHYLTRAVALEPLSAVAQFNLGDALIKTGEISTGVAAYEEAIRLDSTYATNAYNNLGVAMLDAGAIQDAEAAFRRALEADSENYDALRNLAQTLLRQGKAAAAVSLHEKLLSIHPKDATAYVSLAKSLMLVRKWEQAETVLTEFHQRFPQDPQSHSLLGLLRLQQRRFDSAEQAFQNALRISPNHFPARYGLSECRLEQNEADACLQMIESIRDSRILSATESQMLSSLQHRANEQLAQIE